MKKYLVGGAVRDKLLNISTNDRDWVVVGSTPQAMIAQGFQQVGKDFPVFLHPQTHEEYALARTERKVAHGYTGFQCDFSPTVTLEEDLQRRDLTINAMAEDEQGNLLDPFSGRADIEDRVLRHVSDAFEEDPLRVLRVARFAARFHQLDFKIATETLALMKQMVAAGEVSHLVPERVWKELSRALTEPTPEIFFIVLRQCGALKIVLPELDALFGIPQPVQHHPEIDAGDHALRSLQQAALLSASATVRFASLIHDLGKAKTPKENLPQHIAHEKTGLRIIRELCQRLRIPNEYRDLALLTCQYHTHCHRAKELTPSTLLKTLEALDAFRRPERFSEFLLCCEADSKGRKGLENIPYQQKDIFYAAYLACNNIDVKPLIERGFKGEALGNEIRLQRLNRLKAAKINPPSRPNESTP